MQRMCSRLYFLKYKPIVIHNFLFKAYFVWADLEDGHLMPKFPVHNVFGNQG